MQWIGKALTSVNQYYKEINPATLTGAIDIIVVSQPHSPHEDTDHKDSNEPYLSCSPFHVRFGKLSILRPIDSKVTVSVNGSRIPYYMKVGETGEAFFVFETLDDVPDELKTSPLPSPEAFPTQDPDDDPQFLSLGDSIMSDDNDNNHHNQSQSAPSPRSKITPKLPKLPLLDPDDPDSSSIMLDGAGYIMTPKPETIELHPTPLEAVNLGDKPFNHSEPVLHEQKPNDEIELKKSSPFRKPSLPMRHSDTDPLTFDQMTYSNSTHSRPEASPSTLHNFSSDDHKKNHDHGDDVDVDVDSDEDDEEDEDEDENEKVCPDIDDYTRPRSLPNYTTFSPSHPPSPLVDPNNSNNAERDTTATESLYTSDQIEQSLEQLKKDADLHVPLPPREQQGRSRSSIESARREQLLSSNNSNDNYIDNAATVMPDTTATTKIQNTTASTTSYSHVKTLRLTSHQLKQLNLKPGPNSISFSVSSSYSGVATCESRIWLLDSNSQIVISDIDGTITKSDALGHVLTMIGRDWTHAGVAKLYSDIANNGYQMMYLTSRAIGQADSTREYLRGIKQSGYKLPDGPVIMSPDRMMASLHREVIMRKPEIFKMACLRDIQRLFGGVEKTPFYAGFGNRITDALSYRSVNVPASRIFTIDSYGDVKIELLHLAGHKSSYIAMNDLVDMTFPPISISEPEYSDFEFWRSPPPAMSDADLPAELFAPSAPSSPTLSASGGADGASGERDLSSRLSMFRVSTFNLSRRGSNQSMGATSTSPPPSTGSSPPDSSSILSTMRYQLLSSSRSLSPSPSPPLSSSRRNSSSSPAPANNNNSGSSYQQGHVRSQSDPPASPYQQRSKRRPSSPLIRPVIFDDDEDDLGDDLDDEENGEGDEEEDHDKNDTTTSKAKSTHEDDDIDDEFFGEVDMDFSSVPYL